MKASDIKRGNVVAHNNATYVVKAIERSSPTARGGNTTFRFSLYSVPGGQKLDLSLRADDDLSEVDLARRAATYSYKDGDAFVFLDAEDYTPWTLDPDVVGDMAGFLSEGLEGCWVQIVDERAIGVQLPQSVVLEVVDTAPEMKGATATKRPKPAKLSTGIEIQVPEYVRVGERIHVNTDTGEFAGRE